MADLTTPGAVSGLFDLSQLGSLIADVTAGANAEIQGKQRVLDVTAEETANLEAATAANARLTEQGAQAVMRVNALQTQQNAWEQGGMLGALSAIGAAKLNPGSYTAEGRARQMETIQTTLAAGNMTLDAAGAVSNARVKAVDAEVARDVFGAQAGMRRLQAQSEGLALITQGAAASETLRLAALPKMSPLELDKALAGSAQGGGSGEVSIGGFKYKRVEIQEQVKMNTTRNQLALLSPQLTDPDYAAKIGAHQALQLGNMTYDELLGVRDAKHVMPDGSTVMPGVLDEYVNRAGTLLTQKTTLAIDSTMATQQLPQMLAGAGNRIKHFESSAAIQANSGLQAALGVYRASVASIDTTTTMADPTGISQMATLQKLGEFDANFAKAVSAEAGLRAGGDPALTEIIRSQMYGEPANPQLVSDFVISRYTEGKPFGQAMQPMDSRELQMAIDKEYKSLTGSTMLGGEMSATDKKAARQEAAQIGLQNYVENRASIVVNDLAPFAFTRKDNPLVVAGFSPSTYNSMSKQASQLGRQQAVTQSGMDPAQTDVIFAAIASGDYASVNLDPNSAASLAELANQQSVMFEYDIMEQQSPGLGSQYTQWLTENGSALAEQRAGSNLVGNNYQADLFGPMYSQAAQVQTQNYVGLYSNAMETATGRTQRVLQEGYMKAKNPARMFPVVISLIDSITPEQQKLITDKIILPIVNKASEQGLESDEVSNLIMTAMDAGVDGDPELSKAAQRALRGMPAAMGSYNTMVTSLTDSGSMKRAARGGLFNNMAGAGDGTQPSPQQLSVARAAFGLPDPEAASSSFGYGTGPIFAAQDSRAMVEEAGGLEAILEIMRQQGFDK